jgi:hypothetical protein
LSRNQTNLSIAGSENDKVIKPPADLWERLDAEVSRIRPGPPEGAFTFSTFAEKLNLTEKQARGTLIRLCQEGVCLEVGRFGPYAARYFIMRDNGN